MDWLSSLDRRQLLNTFLALLDETLYWDFLISLEVVLEPQMILFVVLLKFMDLDNCSSIRIVRGWGELLVENALHEFFIFGVDSFCFPFLLDIVERAMVTDGTAPLVVFQKGI